MLLLSRIKWFQKDCTVLFFVLMGGVSKATPFTIVSPQAKVSIVYATDETKLDSIAAHLLAQDIQRISGYLPSIFTDLSRARGSVILIGSIQSQLMKSLADNSFQRLAGQWECYGLKVIAQPFPNVDKALIITGSDARGTAYGAFAVSEKMGVTPWYWWADATPVKKPVLSLNIDPYFSEPPSVKYRGIFINDEDWGLQPWAAKTFEPETGDIGPKTYAKVFELLLRLKANFIWPAMHPSTKAFYHYSGNVKMAELYQIVIGSSHAEPMLRNNVSEWDEKSMGHFNYLTNKEKVYQYWEDRVKQSSGINAIYSLGMRGVHDSPIEGPKTAKEAVPLVEQIFADQRGLFQKYINPDVTKVPQVFTAYKEVLDVYTNGLKVPEDVTLIWPDDNYGYIQRLSDQEEIKRTGGSGVYYHTSYWGRPHDYLWLCTTHPALMREEMTKAYTLNAKKLWVLNVGDIKPAEYNLQLFLDMAYRIDSFQNAAYTKRHLQNWCTSLFGSGQSKGMAGMLWQYYNLAWERKPEYMGWSQTEPTTKTAFTAYNHFYFGDQAQQRIDAYTALEKQAIATAAILPTAQQAAYYELVQYPIVCASLQNKKFLYHDKAYYYKQQARYSAAVYDSLSTQAYENIVKETDYYNTQLAGGKWKNMMSMKPRKLPVFDEKEDSTPIAPATHKWGITVEGEGAFSPSQSFSALPNFPYKSTQQHFFDLYLNAPASINYTVAASANWIRISSHSGQLVPKGLGSEKRIWVSIDWTKAPATLNLQGSITVKAANEEYYIQVNARGTSPADLAGFRGFVQSGTYVSMNAAHFTSATTAGERKWQVLGNDSSQQWLQALPLVATLEDTSTSDASIRKAASVAYTFYTFDTASAAIRITTLPTYPLNQNMGMRYGVSVDNGPITIQNFKTIGRSEEWKQNVLSNAAMRKLNLSKLAAGKHTLTIYLVDPGVVLQHISINLGTAQNHYGLLPETQRK